VEPSTDHRDASKLPQESVNQTAKTTDSIEFSRIGTKFVNLCTTVPADQ